MNGKLYFTQRGLEKLENEIEKLEIKLRELQAQVAHVAEVGGDQYHDNASYDLLVIDIRGINWRLSEAHKIFNRAVMIDLSHQNPEIVTVGKKVTILKDDEKLTYEIVGYGESDDNKKLLAYNTPLASLLMGKQKGDLIEELVVKKPVKIEILKIDI